MQSPIGTALNIIHEQFIGEKTTSTDADRKRVPSDEMLFSQKTSFGISLQENEYSFLQAE